MDAEIKKIITNDVREKYVNGPSSYRDFNKAMDGLEKFYDIQSNSAKPLINDLSAYIDSTKRNSSNNLAHFANLEQFLKNFCKYALPENMQFPSDTNFGDIIKNRLCLLNNAQFSEAWKLGKNDPNNVDSYKNMHDYIYEIATLYAFRNFTTHDDGTERADVEFSADSQTLYYTCMLLVELFLCEKYYSNICKYIENHRIESICLPSFDRQIDQEDYEYVDFTWISENTECEDSTEYTIDNIIKSDSLKKIRIQGDAGYGKSTLMKEIGKRTYDKYILEPKESRYPLYIELKNLGNLSIESYVKDKLNLKDEEYKLFMKGGKFLFLLDGYNEVIDREKKRIVRDEIEKLSSVRSPETNRCKYIISDRVMPNQGIFGPIEIFETESVHLILDKISADSKKEYFKKNISDEYIRNMVISKLEENEGFFGQFNTPYKLNVFKEACIDRNEIPDDYIDVYVEKLLKREHEKGEVYVRYLPDILEALAVKMVDKRDRLGSEEDYLSKREYIETLKSVCEENSYEVIDSERLRDLLKGLDFMDIRMDQGTNDDYKIMFRNDVVENYFEDKAYE